MISTLVYSLGLKLELQSKITPKKKSISISSRGGVLKDVLGLEDTFWSPWPWPRVLENWPVLGSRTAVFFWIVKILWSAWKIFWKTFFCWRSPEKFLWRPLFFWDRLKNFCVDLFLFFFGEHLRLCPWSLALASSIPVLGLESVCPRKGCPWPWPRIFFVS